MMDARERSIGRLGVLRALALLLSLAIAVQVAAAPPHHPNFIFIMADDLGWQDVGFMGSQWFETPSLDRLAKESLVFNKAYMYPTCAPSRAALLTGKHSFRTGCYTVPVLEKGNAQDNVFSRWTVGVEHTVYAQPLKAAGYKTIHLGKWHIVGPDPLNELAMTFPLKQKLQQPSNGNFEWVKAHQGAEIQKFYPCGRGFDENVGGTWWGDPARGHSQGYNVAGGGYVAPYKNPFIKEGPEGEWLTDRLTSDAIAFMQRHRDEPFFVNLHYYAPHRPVIARSPEQLHKFMDKPGDPATGQGMNPKTKKEIAAYATMVASIDENVQRIVDALEQAGLREKTVIFFTSDNGANGVVSGTKALRGVKGHVYEGGIRVPALINWPGHLKPRKTDIAICGMDYFPTFLELAGIRDYSGVLDGKSLVPLFTDDAEFPARPLFWHLGSGYMQPACSVIQRGKWKLIQFLKDGRSELYNLEEDQKESKDLSLTHPEVAARLIKELSEWRKINQVPLPPSSALQKNP